MNRPGPTVFILLLTATVVGALLNFRMRPAAIIQPLPFNHNLHVDEHELECTDCHTQATEHPRATLPGIDICQDCHMESLTETALEDQLLAYTTENREIPWQRIYRVPDHVYFSHRRHVTLGNVPCAVCHGDVPALTEPPQYPLVPVTMDRCMTCHEEHQLTNDCLACHR